MRTCPELPVRSREEQVQGRSTEYTERSHRHKQDTGMKAFDAEVDGDVHGGLDHANMCFVSR